MLEICIDSEESAIKAEKAGADRLELCENLIQGGVTPSIGKINAVVSAVNIPVRVLIRPRAGNFVYSHNELDLIFSDISACSQTNCEGIVVGALSENREIPIDFLKQSKANSGNKKMIFHRAFDLCTNPTTAIENLISGGFDTILTSGQRNTAVEGIEVLTALQRDFGDQINILAGGGVRANNILEIHQKTEIINFHSSAKVLINESSTVKMSSSAVSEQVFTVNTNEVKTMKSIIDAF